MYTQHTGTYVQSHMIDNVNTFQNKISTKILFFTSHLHIVCCVITDLNYKNNQNY